MSVLEPPLDKPLEQSRPRLLPEVHPNRRRHGMSLGEAFAVAFQGLMANKMRSFLTMLGIIMGVGAVIVMVALGQGAAKATQEVIQKMGTNRLYIRPDSQRTGGVSMGLGTAQSLELEHAGELLKSSSYLAAVVPEYRQGGITVKYGNKNSRTDVYGSTPEYFAVRSMTVEQGRSFTREDVERRARVCVIGPEVQDELFGMSPPVGKSIRINSQMFQVVGVTKRMGGSPFGNRDDQVTMPITTAMRRLFRSEHVQSLSAQVASQDKMMAAEEEVYQIMRRLLKTRDGEPDPVRIFNQGDVIESANEQGNFLTMLLSGIALVSLIVGGIGIMNIMLVSVTERTREIGIRKAIGAKRKDILYQFLIESVSLSLIGGVIGIVLGVGIAIWMAMPQDEGGFGFPMLLTLPPIIISFGFSALVGVFFGIYPAMKASALDPIIALRHE